ncbi:MAG: polyphosphate kinase 2 family protein [Leptolyngbyaceae cyanobacterium CSU_1_3]|nr:polyphosphate kinase 2 family protein [Leptolyngbyaceae cyanobacterium CSU_1_3]
MKHDRFRVPPGSKISLSKDYDPAYTGDYKNKSESEGKLSGDVDRLAAFQNILYAQNNYALLLIFQAMDAAGKDGTIKHVMSGVNPQGCQVYSFKSPSSEELDHDYLWRSSRALPERGRIGIFNRSYYEEVLVVRVHPELLMHQQLPDSVKHKNIWQRRFEEINSFEKYLVNNGIVILKFFLNVSKAEQKKRFLERINQPEKNWKFSDSDVKERAFWNDYMNAYEEAFNHTSTSEAPWYIIPADHKWFTRLTVADIICTKLASLDLKYPTLQKEHQRQLIKAKEILEAEQ